MNRSGAGAAFALCCALGVPAFAKTTVVSPTSIPVTGPPSALAFSRDGGTMYVAIDQRGGQDGGIEVLRRAGATFHEANFVPTTVELGDIALTPTGDTIVATTRVGLLVASAASLEKGHLPRIALTRDGDAPDTAHLALSRDGAYAFFTNSAYATLGIARIDEQALEATVVAHVVTDRLPQGLALSADGALVFVTSEIDGADPKTVAGASDPHAGNPSCAINLAPHGTLAILDVKRALASAPNATVARVAAGCSPVRVALAPDGKTAWVTARGDNRVYAFDVAKLQANAPSSLAGTAAVRDVPIGLGFTRDGRRLIVANSHRSLDDDIMRAADISVVDPAAVLAGKETTLQTLTTGTLPREVVLAPDGSAFYVTNFRANAIDVIRTEGL